MKTLYTRIGRRRGKQKARVADVRRMLEIIWYMLNDMKEDRAQNADLILRKYTKLTKKAALS